MKRTLALLVGGIMIVSTCPAQDIVFGDVKHSNGKPLSAALILLVQRANRLFVPFATDDREVGRAITDSQGRFKISLSHGYPIRKLRLVVISKPSYGSNVILPNIVVGKPNRVFVSNRFRASPRIEPLFKGF
jgi:hypothetical protein